VLVDTRFLSAGLVETGLLGTVLVGAVLDVGIDRRLLDMGLRRSRGTAGSPPATGRRAFRAFDSRC